MRIFEVSTIYNVFENKRIFYLYRKTKRSSQRPPASVRVYILFKIVYVRYRLQRMPSFYILTMIIPIWLIFCLSIFVFYLPAEAGEKMTLSISILIGQTVFLTLLGNRVPETSVEIPLLGGYLLFTMCMVSTAVACSGEIINSNAVGISKF